MIAFIEGGMRIPIGKVTRDFSTLFILTQCAANMFRIFGSVDAINEKNGYKLYPPRHKLGL